MKPQHESWHVETGAAVGISIRIPLEHIASALTLVGPVVDRSTIAPPDDYPALYATVGRGTLDSHPITHRFVNVIRPAPVWVQVDPALGITAVIGAQSDPGARLFWRHGFGAVPGRLALTLAKDYLSGQVRIATAGGVMRVKANFASSGESWSNPNEFFGAKPEQGSMARGVERGIRYDGSGSVTFEGASGETDTFETYVGLDTQLGWDFIFGPADAFK